MMDTSSQLEQSVGSGSSLSESRGGSLHLLRPCEPLRLWIPGTADEFGRVRFTRVGLPSEPKWLTLPTAPQLQPKGARWRHFTAGWRKWNAPNVHVNRTRPVFVVRGCSGNEASEAPRDPGAESGCGHVGAGDRWGCVCFRLQKGMVTRD